MDAAGTFSRDHSLALLELTAALLAEPSSAAALAAAILAVDAVYGDGGRPPLRVVYPPEVDGVGQARADAAR